MNVAHVLAALAATLLAARLAGEVAEYFRQPAVLGEIAAGVILGGSLLHVVDPTSTPFELFSEIGVIVLMFAIGLETDVRRLLKVGTASITVAVVGVALPFASGYAVARAFGADRLTAIVVGAAMTATSVGITARVLSDLGALRSSEGQIILGAAVFDDILGLVILAVVTRMITGGSVGIGGIALITFRAVGFLVAAVAIGSLIIPPLFRRFERFGRLESLTPLAIALAFAIAALAEESGSALIIGAFAAGLILAPTHQAKHIEQGLARIGAVFVPIFFVCVGAAVDVTAVDGRAFAFGAALLVVAFAGKFLAGYSPFWFRGNKKLIGVGMVPRGEVGLIFAQVGLRSGVLSASEFGSTMVMVFATTFIAPVLLRRLIAKGPPASSLDREDGAVSRLTSEA